MQLAFRQCSSNSLYESKKWLSTLLYMSCSKKTMYIVYRTTLRVNLLCPGQGFIFSVVKFLWNRFSLRLFILLAFTFWSRDLAVFLLKLCSEVVYCWHDLFYFQEGATYLKVNHITMWGGVLEWVWLAFSSVNWCIVKPSVDPSLNFVETLCNKA